jgi:tight adherence protein C
MSGLTTRSRFADRVTPYVHPGSTASAMKKVLLRFPHPIDLSLRLTSAGRPPDRAGYMFEKLIWALLGGLALGGLSLSSGGSSPPLSVILGGAMGWLARDRWLLREGTLRNRRLREELPYALDLFGIAMIAGEGISGALRRSTELLGEPLRSELDETASRIRSGASFQVALDELRARSTEPAIGRFADALSIALERGTPVVETLEALARDLREEERRALLEGGARRELAMLLPVVFLLLPVIVVFALYPGLVSLEMLVL